MLQSGLITPKAMERKYKKELHANEIVLLAYYIASVNIENAYHDIMQQKEGEYTPFDGICLTDTFQLYEDEIDNKDALKGIKYSDVFPNNSDRVIEQTKVPMRVIVGNPPYSVGQKSANDNAQNDSYPHLEHRLAETYVAKTKATNKNALYDSYIKAFRWATDRLDPQNGGIIGFVTNAGWLDGTAMDGMRKCFENEFSSIYIYNLRGNQRTSGELSHREGGKIFGSGSRAPIAVTILVKNPKVKNKKAEIFYHEVDDYLTRQDKLNAVKSMKSVMNPQFVQKILKPNDKGDWLNQRSEMFSHYCSLEPDKKFNKAATSYFSSLSMGIGSSRDMWVYGYNKINIACNVQKTITCYNKCLENYNKNFPGISKNGEYKQYQDKDSHNISWSSSLDSKFEHKIRLHFEEKWRKTMYRPFNLEFLYFGEYLIHRRSRIGEFFPNPNAENLLICVPGTGGKKDFNCLITRFIPDLHILDSGTQCFPLYWYEEKKEVEQNFFEEQTDKEVHFIRHDGITDYILDVARKQYKDKSITKEDIFYYVYGFLHSPEYRQEFTADLKKSLPRIPLVDSGNDFYLFSKVGRELADLHLNYEHREPPKEVKVEVKKEDYRIRKMYFGKKDGEKDKSFIQYNDFITIKNIPLAAYEYVVNGRSAIEWIMESYQIKQDKASGIVKDPNDWAAEHNDPKYILNLLLSIITVSLETLKIVKALPKLEFEKEE